MSRRNRIDGQFAPRLIEILESPAHRVLSLSGHRVLARLEIELAHQGGNDNGKLPVTYEQFVEYGVDRHAIAPAIRECAMLGFIEVTERGRAGNREFRTPSKYRLTYRHMNRANPTNEWKRIQTLEQAKEIAWLARKPTRPKKQKTGVGKRHVSVGKTHTENTKVPMGETHTTVSVGKTHTTSISRVPQ